MIKFRLLKNKSILLHLAVLQIFLSGCNLVTGILDHASSKAEKEAGNNTEIVNEPIDSSTPRNLSPRQTEPIPQSEAEIGKLAQLTSTQIQQLSKIEETPVFSAVLNKNVYVDVVVPTYIPEGFIITQADLNEHYHYYRIEYSSDTQSCFAISGVPLMGAGQPSEHELLEEVVSPALGKVVLGYTKFHHFNDSSLISIEYISESSSTRTEDDVHGFMSPVLDSGCQIMDWQEAKKVVQSLVFLFQ